MEGFFIISAFIAGENCSLRIHDFTVFEIFDFFADFFIVVCVEDATEDETEADGNKNDGEDNLPGDIIREDILSCEEKDDADADYDEAGKFFFVGEEADDAGDDDEQSPPPVKENVDIKEADGVAAENDAECNDGDAPDDWFDLFHLVAPLSYGNYSTCKVRTIEKLISNHGSGIIINSREFDMSSNSKKSDDDRKNVTKTAVKSAAAGVLESTVDQAVNNVVPTRAAVHQKFSDIARNVPVLGDAIDIGQKVSYLGHLGRLFGKNKDKK